MKKIILTISILLFGFFLYLKFSYLFAVFAFGSSMTFILLSIHYINIYLTNQKYAKEYENIYVMHINQVTKEEPFVPEDLKDFVVITDFKNVYLEVEHQKELLQRSGNLFFCDEDLTTEQKIQVKGIIKGDGEFINEDFAEYNIRGIEEIKADRKKRHAMLKKYSPVWYDQFSNYQNGIEWKN